MKIPKYNALITSTVLSLFVTNINAQKMTIEWAPFIKNSQTTDQLLISAADKVNSHFLAKQKGFIKRELIKKNDNEYADIIYWQTKSDAIAAGEKVYTCVECNEYFKHMNMKQKTNEGFAHYEIIRSW
jgi:hypothetical protein